MTTRNYYVLLGVSESESPEGIRRAFRDLARRYHPDRAGSRGTPFFREIVTAYQTLSDPERRDAYDAGLRDAQGLEAATPVRPWPAEGPEPLVPVRNSLMRDFYVTRPSRDEVFDRIRRNFGLAAPPKSERLRPLGLQLLISADDALYGGALTVAVPVFYPCSRCRGSGSRGYYACPSCHGDGIVEVEQNVHLRIPPGVRDGERFEVPLRGLGIHNLFLSVCLRVAG